MDETANEIEAQIDWTRDRLGSNLRELEQRVEAATDWREQFRQRPYVFLGTAFIGGVVLAGALRGRSSTWQPDNVEAAPRRLVGLDSSAQEQARDLWHNIQGALVGVASAGIQRYISELIPGFEEHYREAERRTSIR